MTVGTTKQICSTRPGQLDMALLDMPKAGLAAGAQILTALFSGFTSEMVSVENNQTMQFVLLIDFGAALEVFICPEVSQDHGLTFGPKASVKGVSLTGVLETCPETMSFKKADYTEFLTGNVLRVSTPPYLVPDCHFIRLRAKDDAGVATLQAWKMGGRGL